MFNNIYEVDWHNDYAFDEVSNDKNIEKMISDYIDNNHDDLLQSYCENEFAFYKYEDPTELIDILELDDKYYEDEKSIFEDYSREELFEKYKEKIDEGLEKHLLENEYWRDYIKEKVYRELDEEYDSCNDDVWNYLRTIYIEKLEMFKNKYKLDIDYEKSHSYTAGRFPSVYYKISIINKEDDLENEEIIIRVCDGHNNNRGDYKYQINFHWFDNEKFKKDIDIYINNLISDFETCYGRKIFKK